MKNVLAGVALAAGLAFISVPGGAQVVYVQVAPPAPLVETIPAAPGAGYAWVPGHYRWNGSSYVWLRGHYDHHAGRYCGGHWGHSHNRGYYWVEGRWC